MSGRKHMNEAAMLLITAGAMMLFSLKQTYLDSIIGAFTLSEFAEWARYSGVMGPGWAYIGCVAGICVFLGDGLEMLILPRITAWHPSLKKTTDPAERKKLVLGQVKGKFVLILMVAGVVVWLFISAKNGISDPYNLADYSSGFYMAIGGAVVGLCGALTGLLKKDDIADELLELY